MRSRYPRTKKESVSMRLILPQICDKQMDAANAREALKEVALDISEGADIVM